MSKRLIVTVLTLIIIGLTAGIAVFLAKGYRLSTETGNISGTGIIAATSVPDQASVYLDGHLTVATDANINSLPPKTYDVRIVKEGYIPWEKKVEVKEGLVTEINAVLYRSIPSLYPLTYTGAANPIVSPDGTKFIYSVPPSADTNPLVARKSGLWVWTMSDNSLGGFNRGNEPHQVAEIMPGFDYSQAKFEWSPDSTQVLVSFPDHYFLLDAESLNETPRDITTTIDSTLKSWQEEQKKMDTTRMQSIKDLSLRKIASSSAVVKWAPDETKILYSTDGKDNFKVVDLVKNDTFDMPKGFFYEWLADSEHLVFVEGIEGQNSTTPSVAPKLTTSLPSPTPTSTAGFEPGKISVVEFDGFNKSEIYAGNFVPGSVIVWPDGSRLGILTFFATATASQPNLYGINLK